MMELQYDETIDAAAVLVDGEIGPDDTADVRELDADRIVRYDADDRPIEYQFFNLRRLGARVDDLEHSEELAHLFREAGFELRTWSTPIRVIAVHRRRRRSAG